MRRVSLREHFLTQDTRCPRLNLDTRQDYWMLYPVMLRLTLLHQKRVASRSASKNVTSDVFIDPDKIERPTEIYWKLRGSFQFCSKTRVIPILIVPFIDGSFYCFDDKHKGLHCQTYLQLFNPENDDLRRAVKELLKFGNVMT